MNGVAAEIAAGPDEGSIYALAGKRQNQGGHGIFRWAGDKIWYPVPGRGARHISIGMYGRPHIVTNLGKILWPNCTGNAIEETIAAADIEINVPTEALV